MGEAAGQVVGARVAMRPASWIRPPFARPEEEFLALCDRCGKCEAACPHDVIFKLPATLGASVANGPALDLVNRGCRMCEDWPCVTACAPGALFRPTPETLDEDQEPEAKTDPGPERPPKLARATLDRSACLPYLGPECGACASFCPVPGALDWQGGVKPVINPDLCSGCGMCREACVVDPKAIQISLAD